MAWRGGRRQRRIKPPSFPLGSHAAVGGSDVVVEASDLIRSDHTLTFFLVFLILISLPLPQSLSFCQNGSLRNYRRRHNAGSKRP